MVRIKYDEDADFLAQEILAGLSRNGCWEQVGQYGQVLSNLEVQVHRNILNAFIDAGVVPPAFRERFMAYVDWDFWPFLFAPRRDLQLKIPLNALAALTLLFDVAIMPQRRFEQARQNMQKVFKEDISISNELGETVFGPADFQASTVTEREFWKLFDSILTEFELGSEPSGAAIIRSIPLMNADDSVVKYAARKVAWSVISDMRLEREEQES
jgi:hypothetical protein